VRRLLVGVLLGAGLTVAAPAQACACGGMVDREGYDTSVDAETALVVWDGTSETILLQLDMRTDAVDAGLLIPTPTAAAVRLGDDAVFDDLRRVVAPVREDRTHLFGPALLGGGSDGERAGDAGGPAVSVLSTVDLGPLRATTLTAAGAGALEKWLAKHDYQTTAAMTAATKPYVDEGWSFVAVQLTAARDTLEGALPALALTFASEQAVYPMRMSAAATSPQHPTVYVLAPHRMRRTDPISGGITRPELFFAGPVDPSAVTSASLKGWLAATPYLTATAQWLPEPKQIISDFTFGRAPDDTPYQRVEYDDHYLLPVDLGILLILAILTVVVLLGLRLTRRRVSPPAPPSFPS